MSQDFCVSRPLTYRHGVSVITADVAGEAVLLETVTGNYFALNSTANQIWKAFGPGTTCDAALSAALLATGTPPQQAKDDFKIFASRLIELGLLVPDAPEAE